MTGKKPVSGTDWAKVEAPVITQEEYDEAPELDDDFFEHADLYHGTKLIRRGRPRSEQPKVPINIRLSADVLERFKAGGPGWQSRIDAALKEWLATQEAKV